jgi:hypothetical protein
MPTTTVMMAAKVAPARIEPIVADPRFDPKSALKPYCAILDFAFDAPRAANQE